jgi:hypothetical protein
MLPSTVLQGFPKDLKPDLGSVKHQGSAGCIPHDLGDIMGIADHVFLSAMVSIYVIKA